MRNWQGCGPLPWTELPDLLFLLLLMVRVSEYLPLRMSITLSMTPFIVSWSHSLFRSDDFVCTLCVFVIYPQKGTQEQAKIGELTIVHYCCCRQLLLCGNRAIIYSPTNGAIIVWDFVANTNWSFTTTGAHYVCFFFHHCCRKLIFLEGRDNRRNGNDHLHILWCYSFKCRYYFHDQNIRDPLKNFSFWRPTRSSTHFRIQRPQTYAILFPKNLIPGILVVAISTLPLFVSMCITGAGSRVAGRYTFDLKDLSSRFLSLGSAQIPRWYISASYRICEDSSMRLVTSFVDEGTAAITMGLESSQCQDSSRTAIAHNRSYLSGATIDTFPSPEGPFCAASGRLVFVEDSAFVISDFLSH